MFDTLEQINISLAFSLGFVVCALLGLATYGLYRLHKQDPRQKLQDEFNRQVSEAKERRASLPPENKDRIVKVFKRVDETPSRPSRPVGRMVRDDEETGRFTREIPNS